MRRKLKIAVSVFFALLFVLTLALWARSPYHRDRLVFRSDLPEIVLDSRNARVICVCTEYQDAGLGISRLHDEVEDSVAATAFHVRIDADFTMVTFPHWFLAQSFGLLALAPWISWRKFSIKRLLVVTTYIAVLSGLIILSRR